MASRFVEDHPSDAAHILDECAPEVIGEILATLPAPVGAGLLRAMTPHAAAAGLARLAPDAAAALAECLPVELAGALLLRLDGTVRGALLNALPAKASLPLRLVLRFPVGTVGSLVDARVVTVRRDTRIGEVAEIARNAPELLRKYVYVLDEGQHLVGVADVRQCWLQDDDRRIAGLLHKEPVALRARMSLREASLLPAWERFAVLPVVDHRGVFLGIVRRMTLFGALAEQGPPAGREDLAQLALDLADICWRTASGLLIEAPAEKRRY